MALAAATGDGRPVFGEDDIAALLRTTPNGSQYRWTGGEDGTGPVITYNFYTPDDGSSAKVPAPGALRAMNAAEQAAVLGAIEHIESVADVTFVPFTGTRPEEAEIRFGVADYADDPRIIVSAVAASGGGEISWAEVWLNDGASLPDIDQPGSDGYAAILAEVARTLGLKGTQEGETVLDPALDDQGTSVLSANDHEGTGSTAVIGDHQVRPQTLMPLDIEALRSIYGPAGTANTGDTVYRVEDGVGRLLTIVDDGGQDAIDASDMLLPVTIDLVEGAYSSLGRAGVALDEIGQPAEYNVAIATGSVIEDAIGGAGDDTLIGNDAANRLEGGAGADVITGGAGADILAGMLPDLDGDRITDFEAGDTLLVLDAVLDETTVQASAGEDITILTLDGIKDGRGPVSVTLDGTFEDGFVVASDGTSSTIMLDVPEPEPEPETATIALFGTVELTHEPMTVALEQSFVDPVVIAQPASLNGSQPVQVRISEVAEDSFTMFLQEPDYLDGWHRDETVSWLVVERGSWELADGTRLEAGTVNTNAIYGQGWADVGFGTAFGDAPAVLTQLQSEYESDWVVTRQRRLDGDGFQVTMQEEEGNASGSHAAETIGWLAIEQGSGESDGLGFMAGQAGGFTHEPAGLSFDDVIDTTPALFASISTIAGANPAGLRVASLDASGASLIVEEEASADSEVVHSAAETVSFLALDGLSGSLEALVADAPVA